MGSERIAIVGIGLRHPGAGSREEYASADWLALAVTTAALADAGFPEGDGLPERSTGVAFDYRLTGEFSGANMETLARGLTGTVAGRVRDHFALADTHSSSPLSVATTAKALVDGDLDVAIVGGLDLAIDPFKVVGLAKAGASTTGELKDPNGFRPGVAAGVLVLMRESDAIARGGKIYARVSEWGTAGILDLITNQDAELLLFDADDVEGLRAKLTRVTARAHELAPAELAATLSTELAGGPLRAAVVTSSPEDAERKLNLLVAALDAGQTALFSPAEGVLLDSRSVAPKLGFLFPGRGSGRGVGALRRRFPAADHVFHSDTLVGDPTAPEVVQARVVTGSLAGLRVLHTLGIEADIAVGHSLGELTALAWAGAMGGPELQELAGIRGRIMAQASDGGGAMAAMLIDPAGAEGLMAGHPVVIAGYESPEQTVISGAAEAVDAVCAKAAAEGVTAIRINVPHAFHSPLVRRAAEAMTDRLAERPFERLVRQVASTVTGDVLDPDTDPRALLVDQVLLPVRFTEAAARAARDVDLLIEVGAAAGLTSLLGQIAPDKPVLALDTDSDSLSPLLTVAGAAFVLGAPVDTSALFGDRLLLALDGETTPSSSQCEAAPAIGADLVAPLHQDSHGGGVASAGGSTPLSPADATPADTRVDDPAAGGPWVRPFLVEHVPQRRPSVVSGIGAPGQWQVFAPEGHPLAEPLRAALAKAGIGDGVLLCLPNDGEPYVDLVLAAGKAAVADEGRFVAVQHRRGAAEFARTVRLDTPTTRTTVVGLADTEPSTPDSIRVAVGRVVGEAAATNWFSEVRYGADGTRTIPVLKALIAPARPIGSSPLDGTDVLLVTGAGNTITADCVLAIAQDSTAKLALLGEADPSENPTLAGTLARMAAAGVDYRYQRADVAAAEEVAAAVARFEAELGPVTAVLHGTRASPSEEDLGRTSAPEITELRAVLGAVDPGKLKLLVTFGPAGAAHHPTATDWMSELTVEFGGKHPDTRVLALKWSDADGVTPDKGIAVLREVLADPSAGPVVLISGRTAGQPVMEDIELTMTRFVDHVVAHYPGIELITEVELSVADDPYLADYLLDGEPHFPATMALEAMTQVGSALSGSESAPLLENVEFLRPITVHPGGSTKLRLAALVRDTETVDVVVRGEENGFSVDHVRATLKARPEPPRSAAPDPRLPAVALNPAELYGSVLFQGKRFQRVRAYRKVSARHVVAELGGTTTAPWFAAHLPRRLLLADPGTRDAVMHAIQCCVPEEILLPQGVERLYLAQWSEEDPQSVVMDARERRHDGECHIFDVDVRTPDGQVVERWEGLLLRSVGRRDGAPWAPALLGSTVERSLERVFGGSRSVVVEPDAQGRRQTTLAVSRALGRTAEVRRLPDGVAMSHGAGLTFVVVGSGRLDCAIESAADVDWPGLLDEQLALRDLLTTEAADSAAVAGTRIRAALRALGKTGAAGQALTLDRVHPDRWVVLSAGDDKIATWVTTVKDRPDPVVFAVLSGEER
ncbi:Malonyl CoA-acyl carrier protein transacylase [Actinokineospora alba]|uniref:Malonyl CoA-acyl carrier protein transacylase n=1 Tax=Actinokineospora alba TaxID=504798 RepID=A0A1H0W8F3_9PSEU|nr:acyltransferase domain-containing protein [Actinokineospora alba]TDP70002.1 malonyl CoA-acyl carrier protein transacylase [Actinokineospora alba]SDJ50138.1 Malonyl CoA-acyl carrier protein transacylase [Actinokineospora alba]SDP86576.1 Malonyl CoA-acyl carrier protein transacylase [Actinokineospora alba]